MNEKIARFDLYKPLKKEGAGAAFQFRFSVERSCIFIEAAQQKGPRLPIGDKNQYDWDGKITFKLGIIDMSQIMLTLGKHNKQTDLVHRTETANAEDSHVIRTSMLRLVKQQKSSDGSGYDNYFLKLGKTEDIAGVKQAPVSVQIYMDHHEAFALYNFMLFALERMFGFE